MKILALGDVFGEEAVKYVSSRLPDVISKMNIDLTVANCENASGATGVEPKAAEELLAAGCDVLTGGNHSFGKPAFLTYVEDKENVLRPANYPPSAPGSGYCITRAATGERVLTVNLRGNGNMQPTLACPFETLERILAHESGNYDLCILDMHAEYTSEKLAMLYTFDGKVNVIFGTHTHVPTADAKITEKGTGYITDLGMCGPVNSILGVDSEAILRNMRHKLPTRFVTADGPCRAMGAIFETDASTGKCTKVSRVEF